ncbi:MAG: winged helix-turn-helix domain-containing protein [Gammaproteobacteria bacterium]|nr:winged helix-turn-helix domain-containing protein [Gammaproteobacteria bacterium]MDH4254017.1 winged helix-turn-helix domain-containing protein [Gammaproteobacteria bacterium]MDH5310316.1 winged helix-turn-helix domain-containing protein [Gammaproteobacteria bacterium]
MDSGLHHGFRLAEWEVHPALNRLRHGPESHSVEGKVMGVLLALAEARGEVVSRNELFDKVWPRQDVAEGVLTRAIHELRRALGDSPQQARFIETVPRRGYRLLVAPEPLTAPGDVPRSRFGLAAAAAVLLSLVAAYAYLGDGIRTSPVVKSIAVLPFSNLTGNPDRNYIGEALAEEVIHLVAQQPALTVSARTSSFSFRDSGRTLAEIASILGVDAIIEGSIREERGVQRVTIQLVEARNGMHTGSSTLDIIDGNLFDAQRRIGQSVFSMLAKTGATVDTTIQTTLGGTTSDAYDLYLRGRAELHTRSAASLQNAQQFFDEALRLDEGFAAAHAGLAQLYLVSRYYLRLDAERADALAQNAAERALELDPNNVDALLISAILHCNARRFEACLADFRHTLNLQPGNAQARLWYGQALQMLGYLAEAQHSILAGLRLDPLAGSTNTIAAQAATVIGQNSELQPTAVKARDMGALLSVHPFIFHYYRVGEFDALADALQQYYDVIGVPPQAAAIVYRGLQGELTGDEILDSLTPLRRPQNDNFARELAMMGMPAEALRAMADGDPVSSGNMSDLWTPEFRPVRALPGFIDYVTGLGLPGIWRNEGPPDACRRPEPEAFCAALPAKEPA